MIKYIAILISFCLVEIAISTQKNSKTLKSGTTFELQCPMIAFKQITSMRTYALILNNAQKNMEIKIYIKGKKKAQNKLSLQKDQQYGASNEVILNSQAQNQEQPKCILNKNSKICVLDGFISQFHAKCSSPGSVSMLIVEPAMVALFALQIEQIRQKAISPILQYSQKAVIIFRPDDSAQLRQMDINEIFISNCIDSIEFYKHQFLIGVKGKDYIQILMANEQITGIWSFATNKYETYQYIHPFQTYSLPYQVEVFSLQQKELEPKSEFNSQYYGFKLLICSENRTRVTNLSINITVKLKIQNILTQQEQINQSIIVKEGQLIGKMPFKLAFFFYQHAILSINLAFSSSTHYILQFSEPRTQNIFQPPYFQEDQFLFYSYENRIQRISIQAHILKSYKDKMTPALTIISSGIEKISGKFSKNHVQNNQISQSGFVQQNENFDTLKIQNNKIFPVFINNQQSYAIIQLQIETIGIQKIKQYIEKTYQMSYFKLMLETSYIPFQISVGQQITQFLFENQIKRFIISKQQMESLKSKKLKVICTDCHAFLTYNPDCSNINCCEYSHADQVDVKPNSLLIMTSSTHISDTELIKIQLLQDEKAFTLVTGKIVQRYLINSETYIYESDGKYDLQIIFNSQVQSILLLVTVTQNYFPTKNSFDYQSNQGYIKIPATKVKKNIYIKLLKVVSSYEHFDGNYKIPYSLVILNEVTKLQLIQGRQFSHILMKNNQKQYVLRHPCNTEQNLYLRIHSKSYSNGANILQMANTGTLQIKINPQGQQKYTVTKQIILEDTIDITKFLKTSLLHNQYDNKNLQICQITVRIKNLLQQTLYLSLMFFKQKQIYQIHAGQFTQDHILAGHKIMLFCVIDPLKNTNIYSFSFRQQIQMKTSLISVNELKLIMNTNRVFQSKFNSSNNSKKIKNKNKQQFLYKTLYNSFQTQPSHSQFHHIKSAYQLQSNIIQSNNFTVVLIEIFKSSKQKGFSRNDVFIICSQNQTTIRVGNRLQYQLEDGNSHIFSYPLSSQLFLFEKKKTKDGFTKSSTNNDKQIILQNIKLDGNYLAQAKLKYFSEVIGTFTLQKNQNFGFQSKFSTKNKQKNQDPIFTIKIESIKSKLNQYFKMNFQKTSIMNENDVQKSLSNKPTNLSQVQYSNLFLQFQITCHKAANKYCMFLTSLQTSQSDIRQLTPGVPEAFHINKHSSIIFIYNNLYDKQFKFKVNRKMGFPNYKLCSFREDRLLNKIQLNDQQFAFDALDKCLTQLKNPQNQLNLRIQQNAFNQDSNLIVGRTHQLIINQYNEQYCTNCTYYLGLYSDYNIVEGSIFVMNSNQATYLEQGNSITTIVYRGEPDKYILINWRSLMGIVYEIQGNVQVQVYYYDTSNNSKITVLRKQNSNSNKIKQKSQSVITINLVNQSSQLKTHDYQLQIQPANNMPSALYTLVIMNKEQQIINIKDGVPYQMKYTLQLQNQQALLNPLIKYRYLCENQGIIMVSTKDFDDLDIQLRCRDDIQQFKTVNQTNQQKIKEYSQGKLIDIGDLLKAKKKYKMANRLDINIAPKICNRYQLAITSKSPTISYSILVSSTDIISLPLNKEVPGILKYQTKLYQIYQISVNEKTQVRCTFKFCQGGEGRIMIAKSKKNIYAELYQQEVEIYQDTTFQTIKYTAKPGLFYIKLQFKSRGGILQYTIHAQSTNRNKNRKSLDSLSSNIERQSTSPIKIYKNLNSVSYKVKRIGYDYTQYEVQFYRIVQEQDIFQIQYFIVESTKLNLLKKTQNCNGQYFVELINHHEQIKQTKIHVQKDKIKNLLNESTKAKSNTIQEIQNNQMQDAAMKVSFQYSTSTPYSYITIIPIVYNKQSHQFYHLYIPKYREVQLTNGQVFARVSYFLSQIASRIEQFVDIHESQNIILIFLGILLSGCIIASLLAGIWVGSRYFFKTRTVYILKEVKQEENDEQIDHQNNIIEEQITTTNASTAVMMPESSGQMHEVYFQNSQSSLRSQQNNNKKMIRMSQQEQQQKKIEQQKQRKQNLQ